MSIAKRDFYRLLTGAYEPLPNETSVPDFAHNPLNQTGELYQPVIDKTWNLENDKPTWPGDKTFAVCLTHDVDVVSKFNLSQNLRSISNIMKTRSLRSAETIRLIFNHKISAIAGLFGKDDQVCKFEDWIALEKQYNARSTFFFAPEQVRKIHNSDCMYKYNQEINFQGKSISVAELMRLFDAEGWEIGLHPSWNAHADLDEMKFQKEQIESVLGHSIQSVRQHFLKYDPIHTHRVQSLAGFEYDSTIGFNDNVGFRRGTSYPFLCFDVNAGEQLPLLQIPLIAQDGALLASKKGMRLNEKNAFEYIEILVQEIKKVGGVLTLSWHPHTRDYPGFWAVYRNVLELLANENPWFATVSEVGKWWSNNVDIDLLKFTRNFDQPHP
ncbi:hypothetical protein HQ531_05735 [bacterium]|nr:hypothetical protein [bacterium]